MKRLLRTLAMAVCLMVALQGDALGGNQSQDQSRAGAGPASPENSPNLTENSANVLVNGAYLPPVNNYGQELLAFNDLVGKDIGILHYFFGWYSPSWSWLPSQIVSQVPTDRRPHIMISWEPRGRNCRTMAPDEPGDWAVNTSLYDIAGGRCDGYIRHMAQQLKDLPLTFMIRFGQEMNLQHAEWWVGHYNGDPQLYVDAYRRIHNVFAAEGVANVQWVWSPNYASSPREEWNSLFHYYPGAEYVDWVGIVAFNQAAWLGVPWWSLTDLLDSDTWDHVVREVMCRYAKPILIETASVEGSRPGDGTKAAWLQAAYQQLDLFPFVKAVVWFNDFDYHDPSGADFRVVGGSGFDPDPWHPGYAFPLPQNDGRWTQAYSAAVAREKFIGYVPPLADITPPGTFCGGQPTIKVPSTILAAPGESSVLPVSASGLTEDGNLSLDGLPPQVSAEFSQPSLLAPRDEAQIRLDVGLGAQLGSYPLTLALDTGQGVYETPVTLLIVEEVHRMYLPLTSRQN
jgi:hypothetical protein